MRLNTTPNSVNILFFKSRALESRAVISSCQKPMSPKQRDRCEESHNADEVALWGNVNQVLSDDLFSRSILGHISHLATALLPFWIKDAEGRRAPGLTVALNHLLLIAKIIGYS